MENEIYYGEKTVSFTLCIKNRKETFINDGIFEIFSNILLNTIKDFNNHAVIYLFMPDHAHLILQGNTSTSDVITSVNLFKQKTGFWFYENMKNTRWQKDYFDHIIRNEEDLKNQIYYILNNPVRSGIVENWKEYKYRGSTLFNFDEWIL